jgi:tetratricopeptide (TPR) repeat protein
MNKSRKNNLIEMLEKEPDDVFLNYALALEFAGEKQYDEAEKQFLIAVKIKPDYLPCYYQLGQVAKTVKREKEALEYFTTGLTLAKKQNNQKAVNELNEAIWMLEDN